MTPLIIITCYLGLLLGLLALPALPALTALYRGGVGSPEPPVAIQAGELWSRRSTQALPWVPRSVTISGRDTLVWGAGSVSNPRLMAFPMAGAGAQPGVTPALFQDSLVADALGVLTVAAGRRSERLFALAQRPNPDALRRRSEVRAYDPEDVSRSGSSTPAWTHDVLSAANGPARIAVSETGHLVAAAAWDDALGEVVVHWLDGTADSATLLATTAFPAPTLNGLAISDDGTRLAVTAGLELRIFNATGGLLFTQTLQAATRALALSGDGSTALVGGIGGLQVFAEGPGGYAREQVIVGSSDEVVAEIDINPDGTSYAVAWWVFTSGASLRFELRDRGSHETLAALQQIGPDGSTLQNRPEAVAVSRDGTRAALGAWGDGTSPEVVLLEAGREEPVLTVDLAGSVQDLALDERGTHIVVAAKSTHANEFGSTGSIEVHTTGEDDLALARGPEVGGSLDFVGRHEGASLVLFLVGRRRATPLVFDDAGGALWLERTHRLLSYPAATDSTGAAERSVPIPDLPGLIGTRKTIQAAFRVDGGVIFGSTVFDAWIL